MARGSRPSQYGGTIPTFWPDDTKDTLYIESGADLDIILERIQAKWSGITHKELRFQAEHINTDCIGYDKYDFMDYTNFIRITASADYFKRTEGGAG